MTLKKLGRALNSMEARFGYIFLVVAVIAVVVGSAIIEQQQDVLEDLMSEDLRNELHSRAGYLVEAAKIRREEVSLVAGSDRLLRAADSSEATAAALERLDQAREHLGHLRAFCLYRDEVLLVFSGEPICPAAPIRGFGLQWRDGELMNLSGLPVGDGRLMLGAIFEPVLVQRAISQRGVSGQIGTILLVDDDDRVLASSRPTATLGQMVKEWRSDKRYVRDSARIGELPYYFRSELDLDALDPAQRQNQTLFALAIGVGMLLVGAALFVMARAVSGPLRAASKTAETIARGDFGARLTLGGTSETRELARSFNSMTAELERLYSNLEDEVRARSAELMQALEKAKRLHRLAETQAEELQSQNEELQSQTVELAQQQQQLNAQNELLAHKNKELEMASRLKNEFVANMSHELRTPLNAVIGFSELLMDGLGGDLSGEQHEYVQDIHGAGRHLLTLINDILDLAKIEAGKMTFDCTPVALGFPMQEAEQMMRPLAQRKGLDLQVELDSEVTVLGDAQRLRQIALNLLSNAVKFTHPGGTIRCLVRASEDGGSGELVVSDSGIGIDPSEQAHVFEAFRQVDGSVSRSYEGTGLGLTLVKRFTSAMGGTVTVQSKTGEGSTFTVRFPLTHLPGSLEAPAPFEGSELPSSDVLVVEDDANARELVSTLLEQRGHRVQVAVDGTSAITSLERGLPQVMVLDLMLPEVDGMQVLERLRQLPHGDSVAVLVLSAKEPWGEEADRLRALGAEIALKGALQSSEFVSRVSILGARTQQRSA